MFLLIYQSGQILMQQDIKNALFCISIQSILFSYESMSNFWVSELTLASSKFKKKKKPTSFPRLIAQSYDWWIYLTRVHATF